MRNRTYGGVRGRKTKVGRKLLRFPPTRLVMCGLGWPPRGVSSRALGKREGPDGDKWSKTTQETLGGSEANESERSPLGGHHSPVI